MFGKLNQASSHQLEILSSAFKTFIVRKDLNYS